MSSVTIIQMPTLCIAEKLSREELIDQVNYLQGSLFKHTHMLGQVSGRLNVVSNLCHQHASHLSVLVDAFESDDQEVIRVTLNMLSARRKQAHVSKGSVH